MTSTLKDLTKEDASKIPIEASSLNSITKINYSKVNTFGRCSISAMLTFKSVIKPVSRL